MLRTFVAVGALIVAPTLGFAQDLGSLRFTEFVKTTELPKKIEQKVKDADISKDRCKPEKPRVTVRNFTAIQLSSSSYQVRGIVRMEICSTWFDDDQDMTLSGIADTNTCKLNINDIHFSDWALRTANAVASAVTRATSDSHDISDDARGGKCDHYFISEHLSSR